MKFLIPFLFVISATLPDLPISRIEVTYSSYIQFSSVQLDSVLDTVEWVITSIPGRQEIHSQFRQVGDSSQTHISLHGTDLSTHTNAWDSITSFTMTGSSTDTLFTLDTFRYRHLMFRLVTLHDTLQVHAGIKLIEL